VETRLSDRCVGKDPYNPVAGATTLDRPTGELSLFVIDRTAADNEKIWSCIDFI
jgi:hypothetical protein